MKAAPIMRVAVLASGSGSNFQALADALRDETSPAKVVRLICNVAGARVLERASAARIPTVLVEHHRFSSRDAYDSALVAALREDRVDLVCLAGYMRLLTPTFLRSFPGRVLNVHPALLPSFPGLHAVRQALAAGVRVSGCTVHFVDEGTDTGPIIAQAVVPVLPGDDEGRLADRIHAQEHRLYPAVVRAMAAGRVTLDAGRAQLAEPIA
jgi:phosphoribosylglycinamide formyltransferase-1